MTVREEDQRVRIQLSLVGEADFAFTASIRTESLGSTAGKTNQLRTCTHVHTHSALGSVEIFGMREMSIEASASLHTSIPNSVWMSVREGY